jgi:hypothetical protein
MLLSCVKRLKLFVDKPLHLFPLRQLQLIPGYEQLKAEKSAFFRGFRRYLCSPMEFGERPPNSQEAEYDR